MDMWSVIKWVLIAIAAWWAWNWVSNNFAGSPGGGGGELYDAPYAAPLYGNSPVTAWSPRWYGPRRRRGPRQPRQRGGKR